MISTKGKRKLEFNGQVYYWHIRRDEQNIPEIHISSEDKSVYLTHGFDEEVGIGTQYIVNILTAYYGDKK